MTRPGRPSVSIVVPTCDRAEITRRCLDALAAQTFPDLEIVVVDDGSRDDTPAMLERFAAEHPELRLVALRNDRNRGANASRNRGVLASTGELVAFLDSDCIAHRDWIEQLVAGFSDDAVGAVTGLVLDPAPRSIYDLAFRGTHRVARPGPARRLVAGNLCIRRAPLLDCMWVEDAQRPPTGEDGRPDVSFSGACDEESLAIDLARAGWRLLARPEAVVLHEHHYDRRAFFRQAYHGGRAAADLVRRHGLPPRVDMVPFMLAWGTLPLALVAAAFAGWWPLLVPAAFLAAALAAITYNDLALKGKTPAETLRSFPVLVAYYHVRLAGYVGMSLSSRRDRTAATHPGGGKRR